MKSQLRIFIFTLLLVSSSVFAQGKGVGFDSVAVALSGLKAKSTVSVSVRGGWTVISDDKTNSIWSFTPASHPAHPAVIKRTLVEQGGAIHMDMSALCEAAKTACDRLIEEFKGLNNSISTSMKKTDALVDSLDPVISIESSDASGHSIKLTSMKITTVADAQAAIEQRARSLCVPRPMTFGKYTFDKNEPLTNVDVKTTFVLVQRIDCETQSKETVPAATSSGVVAQVGGTDQPQSNAAIEALTLKYFALLDSKKYAEAYAMQTDLQKGVTSFSNWSRRVEKFNATAGEVISRNIKKITWYKNPAGAPAGTYVAADYVSEFANVPVHCGYIVWLERGAEFQLLREEVNMVDAASFKKLSLEELSKVKQQFGCR